MVSVVVLDVGNTMGTFTTPSTADVLAPLSPMPEDVVREEVRRVLHRAPALTEEVIQDICDALLIPQCDWPIPRPDSQFEVFDYTVPVLRELIRLAPVVTLSNIAVTCGPQRMRDLHQQCGDLLTEIYTSYQLGYRKPAPWLWRYIADEGGGHVRDAVHVGDLWHNDVCGAVAAGARAILVSRTRSEPPTVPPIEKWPAGPDRIAVVDDLRQVPAVIARWHDAA